MCSLHISKLAKFIEQTPQINKFGLFVAADRPGEVVGDFEYGTCHRNVMLSLIWHFANCTAFHVLTRLDEYCVTRV